MSGWVVASESGWVVASDSGSVGGSFARGCLPGRWRGLESRDGAGRAPGRHTAVNWEGGRGPQQSKAANRPQHPAAACAAADAVPPRLPQPCQLSYIRSPRLTDCLHTAMFLSGCSNGCSGLQSKRLAIDSLLPRPLRLADHSRVRRRPLHACCNVLGSCLLHWCCNRCPPS